MAESGKRYTPTDWAPEEFERAITEPTPADREKWTTTDWGRDLPLIPMPKAEREALRAKRQGVMEKIASTPEEVERYMNEQRRLASRLHGPEAARFYAEHFGILGPSEESGS